jgi:hypothetical protein
MKASSWRLFRRGPQHATGRRPASRRKHRATLKLESLEARQLLAADVDVAGLLFRGDLVQDGERWVAASGSVDVGFKPTGSEAFRPLVTLTGDVAVDLSNSTLGFKGTAAAIQNAGSLPLWSSATVASYSIADLLGGGATIAGTSFAVDGFSYTASSLRFENPNGGSTSDARLATQGRLSTTALAGFSVDVGADNAVRIDPQGILLTGVSGSVATDFRVAGATVVAAGLNVAYDTVGRTLEVSGASTLAFAGRSVSASFGTAATPGLVLSTGALDRFAPTLSGSFAIAGGSMRLDDLSVRYTAATDTLQMVGSAAVAFSFLDLVSGQSTIRLFDKGLVVKSGQIDSLQASFTGFFQVAGASISATGVEVDYASATDRLQLVGAAAITVGASTAQLELPRNAAAPSGLVIENGTISSLSARINGTVEVAGASLGLSRVTVAYVAAAGANPERLAVQGTGTLSFGRSSATFKLGGDGLVISAGSVESLDAQFLAGIDLGNPEITAANLFEVAGANVLATGLFARYSRSAGSIQVGGNARLRVGESDITLALGQLGSPSAPGLVIKNGQIESLAAGASGTITIGETRLDVAGMTVAYAAASQTLTLRGAASLTIGNNDPLRLSLGNNGLSIVAGAVQLGGEEAKIDNGTVAAAGGTLTVSGVDIAYDSTARLIRLVGQATYAMDGGTSVTLALPRGQGGLGIDLSGQIASLNATLDGVVSVAGVAVTLAASATYIDDGFEFSGTATLDVAGKGTASLVLPATTAERAGLRIAGRRVEKLSGKVSGAMTLDGLTVASDSVVFRYDATASTSLIAVAGSGTATFGGSSASLALGEVATDGSITRPGVSLVNGAIDHVDIAVTSDFKLGNVRLGTDSARLTYQASRTFTDNAGTERTQSAWAVFGTASIAAPFEGTVALGTQDNPALVVHDGGFVLRNLKVALTGGRLGWMGLKEVTLESQQTDANTITIVPRAKWAFPGADLDSNRGSDVGMDFVYDAGTLKAVTLRFDAYATRERQGGDGASKYELVRGLRIPIQGTPLYLAGLEATVENLDSPANIVIRGQASIDFADVIGGHAYGKVVIDRSGMQLVVDLRLMAELPNQFPSAGTFEQRHSTWWVGKSVAYGAFDFDIFLQGNVLIDWANQRGSINFDGRLKVSTLGVAWLNASATVKGSLSANAFAIVGSGYLYPSLITGVFPKGGSIAVLLEAGGDTITDARVAVSTSAFGFIPVKAGFDFITGSILWSSADEVFKDAESEIGADNGEAAINARPAEKTIDGTVDVAALVRNSPGSADATSLTVTMPFVTVDDVVCSTAIGGGSNRSLGRLDPKSVSVFGANGSLDSQLIGLPDVLKMVVNAEWRDRGWGLLEARGLGTSPATVNLSEPDRFGIRRGSVSFRIFPFVTRSTDFAADGSLTEQGRASFAANASRTFGALDLGASLVVKPLVRFNTAAVFGAGDEKALLEMFVDGDRRRILSRAEIAIDNRTPSLFSLGLTTSELYVTVLGLAERAGSPDLRLDTVIPADSGTKREIILGAADWYGVDRALAETAGQRVNTLRELADSLLPLARQKFSDTTFPFISIREPERLKAQLKAQLATTFDVTRPKVAFLDGAGRAADTLVVTAVDAVTNRTSLRLDVSPAFLASANATLSLQFVDEAEVTSKRWLVQKGGDDRWWLVEENQFEPNEVAAGAKSVTRGDNEDTWKAGTEVLYLDTRGSNTSVVKKGRLLSGVSNGTVNILSETEDPASFDPSKSSYPVKQVKELWIRKAAVSIGTPSGREGEVFTASFVPDQTAPISANGSSYAVPVMRLGERVWLGQIPRLAGVAIDANSVRLPALPAAVQESVAATRHARGTSTTDPRRAWQWQISGLDTVASVPITAINGQPVSLSSQRIPLRQLNAGGSTIDVGIDWQETALGPGAKYAFAVIDDGVNPPVYTNLVRYVPSPDLSGRVTAPVWAGPLQPSFTVVETRQDGFTGMITLRNDAADNSGWMVAFDTPYRLVVNDGNARVASVDVRPGGYRYVIQDGGGASTRIPAGGSVSFDFQATFNGAAPASLEPTRFASAVGLVAGSSSERLNPPQIPEGLSPLTGLKVFVDANANGRWDEGEASTFSNDSGGYAFYRLNEGQTYRIVVDLPKASPYRAADWAPANPTAPIVKVAKTAEAQTADFSLLLARNVVYGRVFIDTNGNGLFDSGERPNLNAVVAITAVDGRSLSTKVGGDGSYQFDLPTGFVPAGRPTVGTAATSDFLGASTRVADRGGAWNPPDPNAPPAAIGYDIPTASTLVLDLDESPGLLGRMTDFALKLVLGDFNAIVVKKSPFEFFLDEFQPSVGLPGMTGLSTATGRLVVGGKQALTFQVDATTGLLFDGFTVKDFGLKLGGSLDLGFGSIEVDGLAVRYVAADADLGTPGEFRLAGRTTLDVLGARVGLDLRNQGLVIRDGKVASIDAALTGSLDIAGQRIELGTLAAAYDASTEQLVLTGSSKLLTIGLDSKTLVRVGTTTKGSATVTGLDSTTGLAVGMKIGGPGIPANATIASLGADGTSVVLTQAADFGTDGLKLTFMKSNEDGSFIGLQNVRIVLAAGKVSSLSATLQGALALDDSTLLGLDGLAFSYAAPTAGAGAAIAIAGATSLTLDSDTAKPIPALAMTVDLRFSQTESWFRGAVERAAFDVGSYSIAFTGLRVEWMQAAGNLRLAGAASLTTATDSPRGLSAAADVDLRWKAGRFDSFTTALSGQIEVGTASVEFTGLQAGYTASTDTLSLAGSVGLRLPASANPMGETNAMTKVFGASASITVVAGALTVLTGRIDTGSLVIGGGSLDLRSVAFVFSRQPDRISFSGSAALAVAGASLAVSLPEPGIVWQEGAIRSFAFIASGSIPLETKQLAGGTTHTTSEITGAVSASYDAQASRLVLSGRATARFDTNYVNLAIPASPGLVIVAGRLQSFTVAADTAMSFGGESFTDTDRNGIWDEGELFDDENGNGEFDGGFQLSLTGGSITYTAATDTAAGRLALAGKARVDFDGAKSGSNAVEIDVAAPGLLIVDGQIETFSGSLVAGFSLEDVTFTAAVGTSVGLRYERQADSIAMFGAVRLAVDTNTFALTLGTSLTNPGIRLERGLVTYASAAITTGFGIGDLQVAVKDAGFTYDGAAESWGIYGSASLTNVFSVGIDLGTRLSPGLLIRDNDWEIRNGTFRASDLNLGAFKLDDVMISLQKTTTSWSVSGAASVTLPMGVGASGSFALVNGAVSSISVGVFSDTGIPIPSTPLSVTSLEGSIQNLDNLDAVVVSGRIGLMAGASVTVLGKTARIAQFFGAFTLDAGSLKLQADAYFGAINTDTTTSQAWRGLIAEGTAEILLDWSRNIYYGDVAAKFLSGVFLATGRVGFSEADGLLMRGTARLQVPDEIPFIGGVEIAGAGFQFQHKTGDETGSEIYVMGWGEILGGTRGLKYDFVADKFSWIGTQDLEDANSGLVLRSAAFAEPTVTAFAAAPLSSTPGPSSVDAPALPGRPGVPGRINTGTQTTRLTGRVNDPTLTSVRASLFYSLDEPGEMEFAMPLAGTLLPATGIVVPVNLDGSWSVDIDWDASALPSGDLWIYGQVDDDGVWVPVYGESAGPFQVVRDIEGRITEPSGKTQNGVAIMRGRPGVPVFADLDDDGIWDAGTEPRAISDSQGHWFLDVPGSEVLGGGGAVPIIYALPDYISPVAGSAARQVVTLVEAGARLDLQVHFTRPVLSGEVFVDSGASRSLFAMPVSGLTIVATGPDGRVSRVSTDNFGRYEIPVPAAGSYSVAVDFAGATFLGNPIRAAQGEATQRRVNVAGAAVAIVDRFEVDHVGIVRELNADRVGSLPALVRLSNDGFITSIEFDASLRGQTIELDRPDLPGPKSYYLYDEQNDRWELVVPPADGAALAGPSAFVIRDDLRILGGDLGITLKPRATSVSEAFRAFHVMRGVSFEVSGLRLEGFASQGPDGAAGRGAAIFNQGHTVVRDVSFVDNTARFAQTSADAGRGGAIYNAAGGELTLAGRLSFDRNTAGGGPAVWTAGRLSFDAAVAETNGPSQRTKLLDIDITDESGSRVPVAFKIRGADADRFMVANGALWLRRGTRLDSEQRNRFTGRVTVESAAIDGPGAKWGVFTLRVTDVNEAPIAVRLSGGVISENMPAGTVVGRFSTVDPDRDDLFTYSLVSGRGGRDNAAFAIRDSQLVATESFNFEMRRTYSVRVRSTDRGGLGVEQVFVIRVRDVREPRTAAGLTLPATFAATAGTWSPLMFARAPLSDANPSATSRIVLTLRVASGAIQGRAAAGVTVGGTSTARTFTGTLDALNRYLTDPRGFVTYRPPQTGQATHTLTAVAIKPNGLRSRPTTATIVVPRTDAFFRALGRAK